MGFTPHAVRIAIGEDISSKLMSFSQHGARAICFISENGAVSKVTLRQNSPSGCTCTYEGCFEILNLSRSFIKIDNDNGAHLRTGALCVSLSTPDGRVFGGNVGGPLIAASPIQVIVGSFMYSEAMAKDKTKESIQTGQPGAMAKDRTKEMELEMASLKEKAEEALKTRKVMESELLASREQLSLEKNARQEAEGKTVELKQQLDYAHSVSSATQNQLRDKEVTLQEYAEKISALEKDKAALTVELNNIDIPAACQEFLQKFVKSQAFVHGGAYINRRNVRAVMLQACEELRQFYPFTMEEFGILDSGEWFEEPVIDNPTWDRTLDCLVSSTGEAITAPSAREYMIAPRHTWSSANLEWPADVPPSILLPRPSPKDPIAEPCNRGFLLRPSGKLFQKA